MQFKPKWHDRIIESLEKYQGRLSIDIINDLFDEDPDYLFEKFIHDCYITTLKDLRRPEDFYWRVAKSSQVFHRIYEVMPQSLKQDVNFCRAYLKIVPQSFRYLSQNVKKDLECLQIGVFYDPESTLNLLDLSKQEHAKILFEVLTKKGDLIEYISQNRYSQITREILKTYQYEKEAITRASISWGEIFKKNPNDLNLFTESELLALLEKNPYLIYDYPKEMRKNHLKRTIQLHPNIATKADLSDLSNDDFIVCIQSIQKMIDLVYIYQSLMFRIKEDQSGDFFNQIKEKTLLFKDIHLFTRLIDLNRAFLDHLDHHQKICFEFNRHLVLKVPALFKKIDPTLITDQRFLISVCQSIDLKLLGNLNSDHVQSKVFDLIAMIYDILEIDERFYAFLPEPLKQIEQFAFLVIQRNASLYTILPDQLKKSPLLLNLLKSKSLSYSFEHKKSCDSKNALINTDLDLDETIYLHEDVPTLEIHAYSNHLYGHLQLEECLISDSLVNNQSALMSYPNVYRTRHHESSRLKSRIIAHLSKVLNFSYHGEAPKKADKMPIFVPSFWTSLTPITSHFWQTVLSSDLKSSFALDQAQTIQQGLFVSCTWLDAIRFCNALSEIENLSPYYEIQPDANHSFQISYHHQANGYRLPSLYQLEAHLNLLKARSNNDILSHETIKDIKTFYHHLYKDEHYEWTNQHSVFYVDESDLPKSPSDILCKNTKTYSIVQYDTKHHQSFRVVRPKFK